MLHIGLKIKYKFSFLDEAGEIKNRIIDLSDYLPNFPYEEESNKYNIIQRLEGTGNGEDVYNLLEKYFDYPIYGDLDNSRLEDCNRLFCDYEVFKKVRNAALILSQIDKENICYTELYDVLNNISEAVIGDRTYLIPYGGTSVRIASMSKYLEEKVKSIYAIKEAEEDSFEEAEYFFSTDRCIDRWNLSLTNICLLLCYVWNSIINVYGDELKNKYGYTGGKYYDKTSVKFWKNTEAIGEIEKLFEEGIAFSLKHLEIIKKHYLNMTYDIRNINLRHHLLTQGQREESLYTTLPRYLSSETMVDCLEKVLNEIINFELKNARITGSFVDKKLSFEVNSITEGLYAYLLSETVAGIEYRKCELCDNLFISSQPSRKYCDVHLKTKTHHKRKLKEKFKTD